MYKNVNIRKLKRIFLKKYKIIKNQKKRARNAIKFARITLVKIPAKKKKFLKKENDIPRDKTVIKFDVGNSEKTNTINSINSGTNNFRGNPPS